MINISFILPFLGRSQPACSHVWRSIATAGVLILTFTAAGCGTYLGADTEVSKRDEQMAAEVKLALVQKADLNAAAIDVQVHRGMVTLEGFVENEDQRQAAEMTASRVIGVTSVINKIHIK